MTGGGAQRSRGHDPRLQRLGAVPVDPSLVTQLHSSLNRAETFTGMVWQEVSHAVRAVVMAGVVGLIAVFNNHREPA